MKPQKYQIKAISFIILINTISNNIDGFARPSGLCLFTGLLVASSIKRSEVKVMSNEAGLRGMCFTFIYLWRPAAISKLTDFPKGLVE